jgi:hypothetical protein
MALLELPVVSAWDAGERDTVAWMGQINLATASLVGTIRELLDNEGYVGPGITSIEHWLTWKGGLSHRRAENLVRIARRIDELPACWALFETGRLTEEAMVRIARRVPAGRDAEVASWAPGFLYSQLTRALASCPELPDPDPRPKPHNDQRHKHFTHHQDDDGWIKGSFCLPPEEATVISLGLHTARDAEFRDRKDLPDDADVEGQPRSVVSWADAFVRMGAEATDALDKNLQRSKRAGDRHQVVLHHDIDPDGTLGPGQLHLGPLVPDTVARYLSCDASVIVAMYMDGKLIGITPTVREPSRALRRAIERRDQGCTHPLCNQRRWVQVHHLIHWEDGGPTIPANLICLCPQHHREYHRGDYGIEGNPEDGTLRFHDTWGHTIGPPDHGPPVAQRPDEPGPFTPPYGERLDTTQFTWN